MSFVSQVVQHLCCYQYISCHEIKLKLGLNMFSTSDQIHEQLLFFYTKKNISLMETHDYKFVPGNSY